MAEKFININLNYDSLFFPLTIDRKKFTDPSFTVVAERFLGLAEKYNFKLTIFVIGRDLQNAEVAARVKDWAQAGHEIANHSYTHNPNLGSLPKNEMAYEVSKSHDIISNCIDQEPSGFLSPSWSTSKELIGLLVEKNYLYDTSVFPSYFQYLVLLKLMILTKRRHRNFHPGFGKRRDKWAFLFAPREPYFIGPESLIKKQDGGLLMIPLPVATPFRIPCWHTMYFQFGRRIMGRLLKRTIKEHDNFYYVVHPRDLIDYDKDLSYEFALKHRDGLTAFEALKVPFEKKLSYMEHALDIIGSSGAKFVTMEEMARRIIDEKKNNARHGDKA